MTALHKVMVVAGFGLMGLGLGDTVVAQQPEAAPPAAAQPAKSADQWIADLGSESYRTRLQAEKDLRSLGKAALPSLRQAAAGAGDGEVQWRAKRLVRQIEGGPIQGGQGEGLQERQPRARAPLTGEQDPAPGIRGWRGGVNLPESVRERFEELFGHMERDFGVDVPRARFFDDSFFRDLQEQLETGGGTSQGMTMQMGPDGVRVGIQQKNDKGEVENKVYEAPDLETFQKQYPGVLEKNGLGTGMRFWGGGQWPFQSPLHPWRVDPWPGLDQSVLPRLRNRREEPAPSEQQNHVQPPPEGKRLGVTIRAEIGPELREHLGLEATIGLMIESVQPGSLAESLGLLRGDIVVRIGDHPVGSAPDVQEALGAIEPNAAVEVRFVRKGVEKTATAVKPAAEAKEAKPADRPDLRAKKGETIR